MSDLAAPAAPSPQAPKPPISDAELKLKQDIRLRQNRIEREAIELETFRRQRIQAIEVRDLLARLRAAARRELMALADLADADATLTPDQRAALRARLVLFTDQYGQAMAKVDL